jgi:hypothetical protein
MAGNQLEGKGKNVLRLSITNEQLRQGLWRSYDELRDMPHAEQLFNVVCKPNGVVPYTPIELAVDLEGNGLSFGWPDPQILRLQNTMLMPYGSSLYELTETYSPALVNLYDYITLDDPETISSGGIWQYADFGDFWILSNNANTIFKAKFVQQQHAEDRIAVCNSLPIRALCNMNGRLIAGGFDPEQFWHPDFENYLAQLGKLDEGLFKYSLEVGGNFILWSPIGGDILWLFYPQIAIYGAFGEQFGYTAEKPYFLDLLKRQDFGLMPMPFNGNVNAIKPMYVGERMVSIVYGSNGVEVLYPVQEPFPTFGRYTLFSGIGAYSRGLVGGNDFKQIFIDGYGCLWLIIGAKKQRLGYEHLLANLRSETSIITYDELNDWFYISDGATTYLLTDQGLSETDQAITSLHVDEGVVKGIVASISDNNGVGFEYYLAGFAYAGMKKIYSVEAAYDADETDNYLEISYKYRMSAHGNWAQTSWRRANLQATTVYPIIAYEIIVCLRWADYSTVRLPKEIVIWYEDFDTRNIRGYYGRTKADDVRE